MTATEVRNVKAAVRERDGYRCTECGMTREDHFLVYGFTLDVHRLIPGAEYTVDGCVTLCRECHGPKPRRPHGGCPEKNSITLTLDPGTMARVDALIASQRVKVSRKAVAMTALMELLDSLG